MLKWFTIPELAAESGLTEEILREAIEKGELLCASFGKEMKRTLDIEYERWAVEQLYKRNKKKKGAAVTEFSQTIANIHKGTK